MPTANTTATGGSRNEGLSKTDDGRMVVALATPTEMGGSGKGTNPEQLIAAGYAGCYLGAMRFAAGKAKIDMPANTSVTSHVSIGTRDDGEGFGLEITLDVNMPGVDKAIAEDLAKRGHIICPISHSFKGNVKTTTNVNV